MVFDRIFGRPSRQESDSDEYIDLDSIIEEPRQQSGKIRIRIEKLTEFRDCEKILKYIREGSIVLAETLEMKNKDVGELKRSIERIKKTVTAINGDIVMGPQSILIVCPPNVMVSRIKE
ncbi:MAG: cell division protein SepF [Candidatus Aenigmarchaeota archaeon]|nr:cell division protein SepF [Candidatus Aenigmarchaeota archaeon]